MIVMPFRGQIWWVNLDPTKGHEQAGTRPCLVVSANKFNHGPAGLVSVVPITRSDKRIPSHVKVQKGEGGLTEDSYVKCEEVRCIDKGRLSNSVGQVTADTMAKVDARIKVILGL